jgi:hypothetical protein
MAKLKTALTLVTATFLLGGTALAADVTGKWSGTVTAKSPSGESNTDSAWISLKQVGTVLTGTAGPNAETQSEIRDGKADGDQFEFKVSVKDATATVRLKLDGESLKGEATIETPDGQMKASLDLKRVP